MALEIPEQRCVVCLTRFQPERTGVRTCGAESCDEKFNKHKRHYRQFVSLMRFCLNCGAEFNTVETGMKKYCCSGCYKEASNTKKREKTANTQKQEPRNFVGKSDQSYISGIRQIFPTMSENFLKKIYQEVLTFDEATVLQFLRVGKDNTLIKENINKDANC